MSKIEHLELIKKMYRALNTHDVDAHDEYWSEDMIWHGPGGPHRGREAFKSFLKDFFRAFPDYYAINVIELVEGDMVAATGYFTATHSDLIYGIPATGKPVKGWFSDFWRIENGRLVENWVQIDVDGIRRQLGANDFSY